MKKTSRGFNYIPFKDLYGEHCSIQESSLATEKAIWVGQEHEKNHHVTGEPLGCRMHLNKKLAKILIKRLQKFVDTGNI